MKIAIFTDSFTPQVNGVVTATVSLITHLADKGHLIYVIAPKYKNVKEFDYKNVKVIRVPSVPAFFYPEFRINIPLRLKILKYLKKENIDLIHFQTPLTIGLQGIIISKMMKVPLVGTFHTLITHPQYLKHGGADFSIFKRVLWAYSKAFYNRCDLITTPSEVTRKELLENGFKNNLKVISNGIDLSNLKRTVKKNTGKNLLFVGRIAYEKNIPYLLECFKLVTKKLPETRLVIVGDGPQLAEIRKRIISMELDKNVTITGQIDHKKLINSNIFQKSRLFITASKTETQGISTLEAQVNGLVCIGLNEGGIKDLIKNNYNGFLIEDENKKEFAEKIISVLENNNLYKKMQKNTLKEVKKHDIKEVIKTWEKEYSKLKK